MKLLFVVCAMLSALCLTLLGTPVGAFTDHPDWQAGSPVAMVASGPVTGDAADATMRSCTTQTVLVHGYERTDLCITQMKGWRYALYTYFYLDWGSTASRTLFVVSIGGDSEFYAVDGVSTAYAPLDNPGTDTLVYHQPHGTTWLYPHFLSYIQRSGDHYALSDTPAVIVKYQDGTPVVAGMAAVSAGGAWLVADTENGVIRTDLDTLDARLISPVRAMLSYGSSSLMELAVSDDGQTVAIGGYMEANPTFQIITVTDDCGTDASGNASVQHACPSQDAELLFSDDTLPDGWPIDLRLSTHGRRLDFYIDHSGGAFLKAALYTSGTMPLSVRYLALGDSFSSGEGDPGANAATGIAYYLPHTNSPGGPGVAREMCHLSSRSYPFQLAGFAGLDAMAPNRAVQSVACNNAHIGDIASNDVNGYLGQDGRLAGLSTADLTDLRTAAMDEFIPGRVRQADFVETYQPQAITLGIGGNDVQFAGIIRACATSLITCSYASDPTDRRNLGESIAALYPRLTALYARLVRLDPSARLYAVGYPRFVNATNGDCPLNVNLDYAERQMVDQGVRYINQVIKAAASTAGVGYLDIENALVGHRLCDGGTPYVNPIDFMNIFAQEGFHPTAQAHAAIAATIERQIGGGDVAATAYCPSSSPCPVPTDPPAFPSFFGDASARPKYVAWPSELLQVANSLLPYLVVRGVEFTVQTSLLASGSAARIELHSEPLDLGSVTVGNDGTLRMALTLPDTVAPGYHTLHIYGTSPSGEPVDIYQILYVQEHRDDSLPAAPDGIARDSEQSGSPAPAATTSENSAGNICVTRCVSSGSALPAVVSKTIGLLPATVGRYWMVIASLGLLAISLLIRIGWTLLRRHR